MLFKNKNTPKLSHSDFNFVKTYLEDPHNKYCYIIAKKETIQNTIKKYLKRAILGFVIIAFILMIVCSILQTWNVKNPASNFIKEINEEDGANIKHIELYKNCLFLFKFRLKFCFCFWNTNSLSFRNFHLTINSKVSLNIHWKWSCSKIR